MIIVLLCGSAGCMRGFSRPGATDWEFAQEYLQCSTPVQPPAQPSHQECHGSGCAQVRTEVRLAREKFGEQGVLTLLAALQEESGEVAKAVLQKLPPPELWSEAVQVAGPGGFGRHP